MGAAASLFVRVGADLSGLRKDLAGVNSAMEGMAAKLAGVAMRAGLALGAALLGAGASAVKSSFVINEEMAKVSTMLGGNIERTKELKKQLQGLAMNTGKSAAQDLAPGMYQFLSAFGDSAKTIGAFTTSVKAAIAGAGATTEAIGAGAAVIKGYGMDIGQLGGVFDKVFLTIKKGQTTLSELVPALQDVVPSAAALGVSFDEVSGTFATLSGVIGNSAVVGTKFKAALLSLQAPSDAMGAALLKVAKGLDLQGKLAPSVMAGYRKLTDETKRLESSLASLSAKQTTTLAALEATYKRTVANIEAEAAKTERVFGALASTTSSMLDSLMRFDGTGPAATFAQMAASMAEADTMLANSRGDMRADQYDKLAAAAKRANDAIAAGAAASVPQKRQGYFADDPRSQEVIVPDVSGQVAGAKAAIADFDSLLARIQAAPTAAKEVADRVRQSGIDAATKTFEEGTAKVNAALALAKTEVDSYGKSLGKAVIGAAGLLATIQLVNAEAGGNSSKLQEMWGSAEAMTFAQSAAKAAGQVRTNINDMGSAAGETQKAYEAMVNGINKSGVDMAQQMQVLKTKMENLGDVLGLGLVQAIETARPAFDKLAGWLAKIDPESINRLMGAFSALGGGIAKWAKDFGDGLDYISLSWSTFWTNHKPLLDVMGAAWSAFWGALKYLVVGVNSALGTFWKMLDGMGAAIVAPFAWALGQLEGMGARIQAVLDKFNPWKRNSPSLVDNVTSGVREISRQYGAIAPLRLARPALAMVGAAGTTGAASRGSGGGPTFTGPITVQLPNVTRPDQFARALYGDLSARTGR